MSIDDEARQGKFLGQQIADRQVTELIGLARGLVADNELTDSEIEFLHRWLAASASTHSNPMIWLLLERMRDIFADGYVDEEERAELTDTLVALTGNDFELGEVLRSTSLPFTEPAPNIDFDGRRFCFTGTFSFGRRQQCEAAVQRYGAVCGNMVKSTDYLVIGDYASAAWKQSSFGRKIERAVEWRAQGAPICIVSEQHWRNYI